MLRRALFTVAGIGAASAATYVFAVRPWWRSWGVDPAEVDRALPGDELVPDAPISDTRGITIDAPPSAVWPWLVQMGFGRGGWYSYDQLDMRGRSAERILPELQHLEPGDILPTFPGGGLVVKTIEPGHALVAYFDADILAEQQQASRDRGEVSGGPPANLRAGGAFLGAASPPTFKASWAIVVEPFGPTQSRLLERFRVEWQPAEGPTAPPPAVQRRLLQPMVGFAFFVMARKQLLGIRERAERLAHEDQPEEPRLPREAPESRLPAEKPGEASPEPIAV